MIREEKWHFEDHYLRGPHAVTRWHPKHGFTTLSRLQNLCFLHLRAFFPSHLWTHFPCGNLHTLFSRHGVFPSYCAQSCSKLVLFGRHCRCLFEKTHVFLHFLFLRFTHASFTSVGDMVVGAAVEGAAVVGAMGVGTAVYSFRRKDVDLMCNVLVFRCHRIKKARKNIWSEIGRTLSTVARERAPPRSSQLSSLWITLCLPLRM